MIAAPCSQAPPPRPHCILLSAAAAPAPACLQPVWVDAKYVSPEVVADYEGGLEYARAAAVLDVRQRGTMLKYLVR